MAPAVERREHPRRRSPDRSLSPSKDRHSSRRRSSPRRERSPAPYKSSPPPRRNRSPVKEKGRTQTRAKSPASESSQSPSPRTKRLRRGQAEREAEKSADRDRGRRHAERDDERMVDRDRRKNSEREEPDAREGRDRSEQRDSSRNGKSTREKSDGGSSRASGRDRSASPNRRSHGSRHGPSSPPRNHNSGARDDVGNRSREVEQGKRSRELEQVWGAESESVAQMRAAEEALETKEKQKPSFELSGKLAEETNKVRGVTLLFTEPADARKPTVRWRLYVFKAGEVLNEPLYVHRQSCYLFGRERRVADIPTDHPSCSKQHAVLQYRLVEKEQADGLMSKQVCPYIMDLGSTNGTFINDNRIEPQRYYELFEKDTIKFGNSSREYVLLHENSNN